MKWSGAERKSASILGERREFLSKKLNRTLSAECPHCLVIAPHKMLCKFLVKLIKTFEMLPIVEVSLIVSMASFNLAVVPRRSRRYQLMLHTRLAKYGIKRTFLILAYVLVSKLCAVVGLNRLYFKWKYFLQHSEKLNRIFRSMLIKPINKTDSCAFIDRRPLIQMLSVTFQCTSQTAVRHFLYIDLNPFLPEQEAPDNVGHAFLAAFQTLAYCLIPFALQHRPCR